MPRNYFERSGLAPYLQAPQTTDRAGFGSEGYREVLASDRDPRLSATQSSGGEADAAAGRSSSECGFLHGRTDVLPLRLISSLCS